MRLTMLSEDTSLFRIGLLALPVARGGSRSLSMGSENSHHEYGAIGGHNSEQPSCRIPVSVLAGLTSAFSEVADRNPDSRLCELCSVLLVLLLPPLPLLEPPPAMTEGRLF